MQKLICEVFPQVKASTKLSLYIFRPKSVILHSDFHMKTVIIDQYAFIGDFPCFVCVPGNIWFYVDNEFHRVVRKNVNYLLSVFSVCFLDFLDWSICKCRIRWSLRRHIQKCAKNYFSIFVYSFLFPRFYFTNVCLYRSSDTSPHWNRTSSIIINTVFRSMTKHRLLYPCD